MIPALLSCVFVIYLYRTLNAPELSSTEPDTSSNSENLAQRLSSLQTRIANLDSSKTTGKSS